MIKNIYNKSIKIAGHKNSKKFLGFISFIESFIFPIPPDVFIIPMTIAKKNEWKKIALIATTGSVLGACLGYLIGYIFFNEIGIKIFELYGVDNTNFLKDKVSSDGGTIAWITLDIPEGYVQNKKSRLVNCFRFAIPTKAIGGLEAWRLGGLEA